MLHSFLAEKNWCDPQIQFRCSDGFCIRKWKRCDGVRDCTNGSDEKHCMFCGNDQFKCQDSKCIDNELVCDGAFDCKGGEDELACTKGIETDQFANLLRVLIFRI